MESKTHNISTSKEGMLDITNKFVLVYDLGEGSLHFYAPEKIRNEDKVPVHAAAMLSLFVNKDDVSLMKLISNRLGA